jgi:hypothetical protein
MAATDAGLSSLALATYSNSTYYSTFFGGSGNYASIASTVIATTQTTFTVECWMYMTQLPTTGSSVPSIVGDIQPISTLGYWSFGPLAAGTLCFFWFDGAAKTAVGNTVMPINTWNHIAVSISANTIRLFVNGVLQTITGTSTLTNRSGTNTSLAFGQFNSTSSVYFGYVSNLRILNGAALYTAAFNPPTTQLTAITNTALLTCNTNGFTDGSVNNFTITRVGNVGFKQFTPLLQANASVTLSPTFSTGNLSYTFSAPSNIAAISITPTAVDPALATIKYNGNVTLTSGQSNIAASGPYFTKGYSAYFTTGLFQNGNSIQNNTQGYSWTAEMWVYPNGNYTAINTLFSKRTNGSTVTAYEGYLTATNGYLTFFNGTVYSSTYSLVTNTWSHVAYTYDGNQVSIYVNGNKVYGVVATVTDVAATPLTIGGKLGYSEMMIGNISNFRFVKGYQIYTQTFTPPTQPLDLVQSSSSGIRAIGNGVMPTGGYSVRTITGPNTYLTVATNAAFALASGDFTVEFYINPLSITQTAVWILSWQGDPRLQLDNATLVWYTAGVARITSGSVLAINKWTHIALVRLSGVTKLYADGVQTGSSYTDGNTYVQGPLDIGYKGASGYFGYLSNIRVVKGTAVYTTTFTPPTSPLTAITNTGLLIYQTSFTTDASGNNFTVTPTYTGSATPDSSIQLATNFGPFSSTLANVNGVIQSNGSSGSFNGTSAYLTSSSNTAFDLASGNFTIEGWLYLNGAQTAKVLVSIGDAINNRSVFFWIGGSQQLEGFISNDGTTWQATYYLGTVLPINTWVHFAFVRIGTILNVYINGVATGGTQIGTPTSATTGKTLYIGGTGSAYLNGYLSNVRIVKGVALYTANFTPNILPLVAITNTSLLALQNTLTGDASTNNFTLTNNNVVLSTTVSPFISTGANSAGSTALSSASVQYLTVSNPYVPALSLGQGHNDFTAEAWVYLTATPPAAPGWYIMQKGINSTPGLEWSFSVTSTGLYFQTTSGIPTGTTTSTAFGANIIPGQWMHLALTKVGTSVHFWFNGIYTGTVNGVNNLFYTANVASYITVANTQTGATTAFTGFISNARVVYGKALYTVDFNAGFTPSTTPLTPTQSATSSVASIDNAGSYVVNNGSSVYFNNTNDFLTFPEPASNFYSAQFNGTSQYLTMPNSTVGIQMGSGDFTIECWVYPTTTGSPGRIINNWASGTQQSASWEILQAGGGVQFNCSTAGTTSQVNLNGGGLNINGWNHLAGVRIGNVFTLYMNGVSAATTTQSITLQTADSFTIGARNNLGSYVEYFAGFISNVRIIKGTGIYTTGFTPSSIPLTRTSQGATASQVSFLALQNNTIKDNSSSALTITNVGSTTVSLIHPFTTYGDGTNVTVEAWVMLGVAPTTRGWIINNSATTTGYFGVAIETARTITVWSDSNVTAVLTSAIVIPLYTWTHIAVVYVNQLITIYINGVRDTNTIGKTTAWQPATLGTVYIGRQASAAAQYFPGYITNLRMVYGLAVYTSKFTVPISPLTAIDNTVFLGLQSSVTFDASTNNATITRGAGATGLLLSPLTSPFTTYLPTVTNGNSIAFGWLGSTSPTDYFQISTGYGMSLYISGNFTVEAWIYMAVSPTTYASVIDTRTATTDAWLFGVNSSRYLDFYYGSAGRLTGSTTVLAINTWYHIAATKQDGLIKLWVNGIQEASVSFTTEYNGRTQASPKLSGTPEGYYFSGYLSNVRFINGTAIYTGTFTPSVTPYSLTTPSSTNTLAVTGITTYPSISNPNGVNYSGSYFFGGNASVAISIPNTSMGRFELSTFDFTIEAWFYYSQTFAATTTIIGAANSAAGSGDWVWDLRLYKASTTSGTITFNSYLGNNGTSFSPSYAGTINSNQWYHVAAVRIGTTFTLYLNGVSVVTNTIFANSPSYQQLSGTQSTSTTFSIGGLYSSGSYTNNFYGYISNIRVIKGYGVYTNAFTPSTSSLPNTQGTGSITINAITGTSTSLLALQNATTTDASTNNFTLTATGSPTVSSTIFPLYTNSVTNGSSGYFKGPTYGGYGLSSVTGGAGGFNQLTTGSTGDWTVECWVYMMGAGPTGADYGSAYTICGTVNATYNGIYFLIGITNVGYLFMSRAGGAYITVSNTTPSLNTWAHLAFVNVGTTMNIYLNGVKLANTVSLTGTGGSTGTITTIGANISGQFNGYISNLRAVLGVQVYTGNFTVPTSPLGLTQSSGTNISAITAGQTKLLMLQSNITTDSSTNAYTFINYSGATNTVLSTVGPFPSTNGYSVGFTGSSQYLTAPSNAVFTFGTGDFTIEAWIYLSSGTTGTIFDNRTGSTTVHPVLYVTSSSIRYATGGTDIIFGSTLSTLTWYHIALVKISNITKLYVNGTQSGGTYADINNYLIGSPSIGTGYSSANPLTGYISNLRVVKGTGVYTNTFTTPTSTLTSTQSSSGSIIALGNAIPALGNSVYFNGTTDYMKAPSNDADMGTGDFTIETYYYPTSFATITTLFGQYTAATTGLGYWNLQITTAGVITVYYNGSTNFTALTILPNEWYHIALVRISGTITVYVNGMAYATQAYSGKFGLTSVASPIHIGVTQGASTYAIGYMSNLRIVKGLGVYTGAFAVPTSPLSATQSSGTNIAAITSGTSLLLYQNSPFTDNSTNNNIVTGFGNPQYSPVFSPSFFTYPTPVNGNSGYFNGSTSFLSLTQPSNAGTAEFTIEMWIYPTTLTSGTGFLYLLSTSTTVANCYHLSINTGSGAVILTLDGTAASITSTGAGIVRTNTWTHIAISRHIYSQSNYVFLFVNGVRQGSGFNKTTQFGDTGVLNIGRYQPSANQYFNGYITNVRFVYGSFLYSGHIAYNPVPLTAPLTAITGTTLLLLQSTLTKDNSTNNVTVTNTGVILSTYTNPYSLMQLPVLLTGQNIRDVTSTTGFMDNSRYNETLTSGNLSYATYQNTVSPFGITPALLLAQSGTTRDNSINNYPMVVGAGNPNMMPYVTPFSGNAIAFNGTSQYITGTSLYNGLGGDFTIEFFMKAGPQTATVLSTILTKNGIYNGPNTYGIYCSNRGTGGNLLQTIQITSVSTNPSSPIYVGSIPVCDSKWHHIAIVRISNIVTVYIDGVIDTGTFGTTNGFTNTASWDYSNYTIGSNPNDGGGSTVAQLAYNGMLSNLRIINGTGIYTGTFTPPTNTLTKSQTSGTNIVAYTPSVPPSSTSYSWQFKSQLSTYTYLSGAPGTNLFKNDYTVEFWHYLTGRVPSAIYPCFFSNGNMGAVGNLNMYAGNSAGDITKYQVAFNTNSFPSGALTSNTSIIYGKWTHIAVVRRSGIVYLYINGILDSSSTLGNYNVYGFYWYIGTSGEGNSQFLNGFISNFRVVNGVAVYTGNFTTPTSALTATQSSSTNIAAISNSLVSNGGAVQFYTGTYQTINTYYGAPLHFNTGTSDWTVEAWIFLNTLPTVDTWASGCMVLFGSDSAVATDGIHCVIGTTQLFIAATNVKYGTATHGMSLYTWYHVAYVRYNNVVYFYVNGNLVGYVSGVPAPGTQSNTYIGGAASTSIYSLNGYMSNLRFVRGLAVYTNAFTPSIIIPASQNSSININAITGTSTSALILQNSLYTDASTNNFTVTTVGSPSISSTIVPYFPVTNGNSVFFNGGSSNDKLTLASSSVFDFSNGAWTIEFWMYPTVMPTSGNQCRILMFGTNASGNAYDVAFNNDGSIIAIVPSGSPTNVASVAGTITTNTWYHVAVSCNAGLASLYINGVLKSGPTYVLLPTSGAITLNIGYDTVGTVNFQYQGYLSNLRIVKGVGVYTGAFTPSISPLTTTQSSGTNINAITGTTPSNGYSISLNGTTQYLTVANSFMNALSGTYTIEGWFNFTTVPTGNTFNTAYGVLTSYAGGSSWHSWGIGISSSNYAAVLLTRDGATFQTITTSITFQTGIWVHIAFVNDTNNLVTMYINGAVAGSVAQSGTWSTSGTTTSIGVYGTAAGFFKGSISSLRVNNTAVYSGAFTPNYTTPLTAISGTVFLTAQNATIIDNSTNVYTITNVNTVTTSATVTPFLSSTQLLMLQNGTTNDTSTNNFTATITGAPSLNTTNMTYMPFVLANGKSISFVGARDYMRLPSNAAFTFGTNNFTIEGWIYITQGTTGTLFDGRTGASTVHPVLYVSGTVRYATGGTDRIIGATLSNAIWYHIAVTRISGSTKLYVNGTQSGSTYVDSNDYLINSPYIGAGYGYNAPLIGYISNVRVVKGIGVYLGNFNVTTIPLTSTQSATTNVQAISAKLPVNGNAAYASGGIIVRGQFTYGTGFLFPNDFTIEAWVNPYSLTTAYKSWFDSRSTTPDTTGICVGLTNATGQWGAFSANNTNYVVSTVNLILNTWQHVAVVRIGTTMTLYLNGSNVGSATVSNNFTNSQSYLGSQYDSTYGWIGYISNLRVVRDIAVYTGNFTPPTSPLTWYQPSGTNIVGSTKPAAPTNGSSVLFNGTTDYLVAPHIAAYQFTGNYSIECWFYTTTVSTSQMIMSKVSNKSTIDWYIKLNAYPGNGSTYATSSDPNSCQLEFYQGSPSVLLQSPVITYSSDTRTRMGGVYPNTWNHVAVIRAANVYYMILNGSYYNTTTMSTTVAGTPAYDATNNLNIGVNGVDYASNFFSGYITNVRIVNGTFAYTPSYYFSPSFMPLSTTQALNNFVASQTQNQTGVTPVTASQTAFLGLQNTITGDNSTNNNTLTAYGTPSLSTSEHPFTLPLNGYSAYFNGAAYLNSTNTPADFTTNTAWTMEAWFQWSITTLPAQSVIMQVHTTTTNLVSIRVNSSRNVVYNLNGAAAITTGAIVTSNVWHHVALVKNGATTTLYFNGVNQGTTTSVPTTGVRTLVIGYDNINNANYFTGYISNARIVKDVAVYTGAFTVPTSPLTLTQSSGTNISAVTGASTLAFVITRDMITDLAGGFTMQVGGGSAWPTIPHIPFSPFLTAANYVPSLLAFQTSYINDTSPSKALFSLTGVQAGDATWMDYTYSPFGSIPSLLTARTGRAIDNSVLSRILSASGYFTRVITPSGVQTPTAYLTAQTTTVLSDAGADDLITQGAMTALTNVTPSTLYGPFNNDTPLLALQNAIAIDNSNNRSSMTVVGGGVSPTDSSPFTTSKSLTSLLTAQSTTSVTVDNSYSVATITATNTPLANNTYSPFFIPSSTVAVLGLQSNILTATTGDNWGMVTNGGAPTSNASSPFGTYYANGILTLNTNSTTGIYGSNIVTYANLLVTAGDAVTTNAYSITITSLNNVGNIGNRTTDIGLLPTQSNANISLVDLGNTNATEATILTFANTTITPALNIMDYGYSTAPSNTTFIITDVANSNLGETLSSIFVSNVSAIRIPADSGLAQVAPSNTTFFISDVANSNISETIANVTIGNVSTTRSIADTGTQPPPSPVGGTILFPTYSYTDGVTITAANVQGGGSGSSTASNQQVWYQT